MRLIAKIVMPLWFLSACGHAEDAEPVTPPPAPSYELVVARANAMSEDGWIVSRWADGTPEHRGDSLIWTGMYMGATSCEDGAAAEAALLGMLRETGGRPYRHPTIKGEYTLDGLLGLWWGILQRVRNCPESRAAWAEVLPAHERVVRIEPGFDTVLQTVMAELGLRRAPGVIARGTLGTILAGWATLVSAKEEAAYRLHLAWIAFDMVDMPRGRDVFCSVAAKAQIALIDDTCGRDGLQAWFQDFAFNRYEYAFQRAAWEGPDGKDGLETPAVDWLVAATRVGH